MTPYRPTFDNALPADLEAGTSPFLALRAVLDLPFTHRMHCLRRLMFIAAACMTRRDDMRGSAVDGMRAAKGGFDVTMAALLRPADHLAHLPAGTALIEAAMAAHPQAAEAMQAMGLKLDDLAQTVTDGRTAGPGDYDAILAYGYGPYTSELVALAETMTADSRAERDRAASAAQAAHGEVEEAVARIARIGRTVRLISVNAHVEAARAGDAGRVFGVIAGEIKALSEQTAEASATIGHGVATIMRGRAG